MLVQLKSNFYGPDGVIYKRQSGGTQVPDALADKLPKTAKVLEGAPKEEVTPSKK